jgi:hypothetical protein
MSGILTQMKTEPELDDILDDPIVRLMMRGDGIGENDVRRLIEKVRTALGATLARDTEDALDDDALVVSPSITERVVRAA